MESIISILEKYVTGFPSEFPWFVALLLGTGILVTVKLGFIQIRHFWHAIDIIRGKYDNPEDEGDVSHFQALTVALSATVGVGNIAGVALAIHWGGPGALFWMWVTAVFGMALKYTECSLAMKYRTFDANGNASGGPMFYIEKGLGMKWAGIFFAICAVICSFGSGNMNQSNTISSLFLARGYNIEHVVGIVLAVIVGVVIIGGIKRIASVTEKLAPLMAIIYFIGAILIILLNITNLPLVLKDIFTCAFNPASAIGGTAAGAFSMTMLMGIKRGLFSNEAGQGSAAIAHASAKTKEPVREGLVAMVGPFIDTLVICSLTGFAILSTGANHTKYLQTFKASDVIFCEKVVNGIPKDLNGKVTIQLGKPQAARVVAHHATIDEVKILTGQAFFTGALTIKDGRIENPAANMKVQGKALLLGAPLTGMAFKQGLSKIFSWGNLIVELSVLLFALSTMISWSYYGDRSFQYMFGVKYVIIYKLVYCFMIYLGSVIALDLVWRLGDLALAFMAIPNLISLIFLNSQVCEDMKEYFSREQKPYW
ncbi:alanine/glycine:cation symporter family protein [Candidatus Riflebacteria bacterium]